MTLSKLISRMNEDNQEKSTFSPFLELPRTNRWLRCAAVAQENPVGVCNTAAPLGAARAGCAPPLHPQPRPGIRCGQCGDAARLQHHLLAAREAAGTSGGGHSVQRNLMPCESLRFTAWCAIRCDAFHCDTLHWNAVQCKFSAVQALVDPEGFSGFGGF